MALVSDRIHKLRLSTWSHPIPVERDEVPLRGTSTAASKLAAIASIGQRVTRRTTAARQRLLALSKALSRLPLDERFQRRAVEEVRMVACELEKVAADFESEFQAELARVGSSSGPTGGHRAAYPRRVDPDIWAYRKST